MIRYSLYLVAYIIMQIIAWIITPLLPLFTEFRYGKMNNSEFVGIGERLKSWLFWFDTPDNSLDGDERFMKENGSGYWQKVMWLYRNSLYGFKWSALACCDFDKVEFKGDPYINRNNGITGYFVAKTSNGYWQYKIVKKLRGDFGIMFNFGWQLDDFVKYGDKSPALFQFSPRVVTIK